MNQPASKDPSMDEILSSIRQIIADDEPAADEPAAAPEVLATEITNEDVGDDLSSMVDAVPEAVAEPMPLAEPVPEIAEPLAEEPLALSAEQMLNPPVAKEAVAPEDEPLALSPEQMLNPPASESAPGIADAADDLVRAAPAPEEFVAEFGDDVSEEVEMVVPDDIAFINDDDSEEPAEVTDIDALTAEVDISALDDIAPAEEVVEEVAASPLPDQSLTTQMSEELLEPTTQAAAQSAFSQLDALTLSSGSGQTVEDLIREMLRPMLKSWLDENLPGVVEKLVQREIERVSRGNR